jgi:hypothetical protein
MSKSVSGLASPRRGSDLQPRCYPGEVHCFRSERQSCATPHFLESLAEHDATWRVAPSVLFRTNFPNSAVPTYLVRRDLFEVSRLANLIHLRFTPSQVPIDCSSWSEQRRGSSRLGRHF